ncbi:MAG TPA: DUF1549 and DUF1553 domain-containing protein, partial [Armatimonadota bacterium]|nr:DUF1549 and DUF1553 domain-containing protein [Armatimonadota bacterium]
RPAVPAVKHGGWARTPIDRFILAKLEARRLPPPPAADRRTLLRRVYLDLIGLSPTPEAQRAFLQDRSPNAWEKVVDGLLARPEYGERWARHWLDVVRYAESNGYERDGAKPQAWRYRDWVINALNTDRPYDRFLTEQIAGDEVEGSSAETQIATTFLRLGTWDDEPADPAVDRCDQLDDILGTTATAFMAVTLRCARCHDHKFEPFTQKEYYQFLSVFEPLKRPQDGRADLDRFVGTEADLAAYREAAARADAQVVMLRKELDALEAPIRERLVAAKQTALPPDALAAFRAAAASRTDAQKALVAKYQEQSDKEIAAAAAPQERARRDALLEQMKRVNAARPPEPPRAYVLFEDTPQAPVTHVLTRGNPETPAEAVQPALPAVLVHGAVAPPKPLPHSTGRRLWLARWLTRPDNPLTARVMVNRLWQGHFGEGIVASENDFGVMGQRPSNPELLDWLASEFVAGGWSMKRIHRLIVTSNVYKAAAVWNPAIAAGDPDGVLHARWRPRRLEAEAVRDSILSVSGQLNPERGGPSVFPVLPRAVLEGQSRPG